jgi:hypothetical protein
VCTIQLKSTVKFKIHSWNLRPSQKYEKSVIFNMHLLRYIFQDEKVFRWHEDFSLTKPYNYHRFFITTSPVVMVINMVSKICVMGIHHVVLMLPIATSEAHVGLMGRRHCKYRITNMALSPSKYCIVNGSENKKTTTLIWMSEWLLFKAKWAIYSPRVWGQTKTVKLIDSFCFCANTQH